MQTVKILGSDWTIVYETLEENKGFEQCDGYTDATVKKIHIRRYKDSEIGPGKDFELESVKEHDKYVLRHEVIHAFFNESGLWQNSMSYSGSWAMNEEMVDWFAWQYPKIQKAFQILGIG